MQTFFTTTNGSRQHHMIDDRGNHFVTVTLEDGRKVQQCVNPLKDEGNIGDTYPKEKDRTYTPVVIGYVELKSVEQPRGSGHMITVPVN